MKRAEVKDMVSSRRVKRGTTKHGQGAKYLTDGLVGPDGKELSNFAKKTGIICGRHREDLSEEEKRDCLEEYFQSGNMLLVARKHNLSYEGMKKLAREDWFKEELRAMEHDAAVQLKVRLTKIMDKSLAELEDRLESGNQLWRDGALRVVPLSAMDLTSIASTVFEKKREIEAGDKGLVTDEARRLLSIAEALRSKVRIPDIVEGEVIIHVNDSKDQ